MKNFLKWYQQNINGVLKYELNCYVNMPKHFRKFNGCFNLTKRKFSFIVLKKLCVVLKMKL
jgi:hypothetical protein